MHRTPHTTRSHPLHLAQAAPRRGRKLTVRVLATAFLAAGLLVTSAGAIGASQEACGDYSFGFTGTRLINDGISESAGPFAIDLPAGTYDVTMWSNDNHPSPDYQIEQTNEQWYFALDNGYQSPPSDDIPADRTSTVTTLSGIELDAATAISVHHVEIGGVNSVNVECVGFTPSIDIAGPVATTLPPKIIGPETTTTTIAVAPPASTAEPQVTAPATTVATPTTTAVPVEVKQEVELPEAQLAVTGTQSDALLAIGLLLLTLGVAFVVAERRMARRAGARSVTW